MPLCWSLFLQEVSPVSFVDDDPLQRIALNFSFPFYGASYSTVYENQERIPRHLPRHLP